jgi:hypothetical protein
MHNCTDHWRDRIVQTALLAYRASNTQDPNSLSTWDLDMHHSIVVQSKSRVVNGDKVITPAQWGHHYHKALLLAKLAMEL